MWFPWIQEDALRMLTAGLCRAGSPSSGCASRWTTGNGSQPGREAWAELRRKGHSRRWGTEAGRAAGSVSLWLPGKTPSFVRQLPAIISYGCSRGLLCTAHLACCACGQNSLVRSRNTDGSRWRSSACADMVRPSGGVSQGFPSLPPPSSQFPVEGHSLRSCSGPGGRRSKGELRNHRPPGCLPTVTSSPRGWAREAPGCSPPPPGRRWSRARWTAVETRHGTTMGWGFLRCLPAGLLGRGFLPSFPLLSAFCCWPL